MVSRRRLLQTGGAAVLAALAGCQADGDDSPTTKGPTNAPTDDDLAGTTPNTATPDEPTLSATVVEASEVESGSTVVVATSELHALVSNAATADGRVDLQGNWDVDGSDPLALGQFEFLEFRGEAYQPNGSYTGFAGEAGYEYSLHGVNESEVDGDVLEYASLNESERAAVDEMLANGSYNVGHHEEKPDALGVGSIERHQYLRADNETYKIQTVVGDYAAHYMLRLDAANPGGDAQVVTVANREPPQAAHDVVQATRLAGDAPLDDEDLVSFFESVDYVVTLTAVVEVNVAGGATE